MSVCVPIIKSILYVELQESNIASFQKRNGDVKRRISIFRRATNCWRGIYKELAYLHIAGCKTSKKRLIRIYLRKDIVRIQAIKAGTTIRGPIPEYSY